MLGSQAATLTSRRVSSKQPRWLPWVFVLLPSRQKIRQSMILQVLHLLHCALVLPGRSGNSDSNFKAVASTACPKADTEGS